MSDFDESLDALDARLEEIQRRGKALVSAVGRARASAKLGRITDIPRGLHDIVRRLGEASEAASGLADYWQFDTSAYLADGRFLDDLRAAAAETGLRFFEHDGRIYCFPLLVRVDPKANAVKIGRKLERRIRPSALARLLVASQQRPQRFREVRFLQLLYDAWRRLAGDGWRGTGVGPTKSLADIHDTLTLLPGTDYPVEEFARDLLLLDRQPDLRTRDGCRFEFPTGSIARGRRGLVVYDERGAERTYCGQVREGGLTWRCRHRSGST